MPVSYTLTIHIAEGDTPRMTHDSTDSNRMIWKGDTSSAGHMWYSIRAGDDPAQSYGFAPEGDKDGVRSVAGEVSPDDSDTYHQPLYERTMEINEEQYNRLMEFGQAGLQNDWSILETDTTRSPTVVWISPGMRPGTPGLSGVNREGEFTVPMVQYTSSRNPMGRSGPILKGI